MTYSFPCTQCGVCCKNISHIPELQAFDLGNGVCKYLDSNMCKIYDNRPEICSIESMYKKHFYTFYTAEEFMRLNIQSCNAMQEQFGIEDSFRIRIDKE